MTILQLQHFFFWGWVVNYAILLVWFLAFVFFRNGIYSIHSAWFKMPPERFDAIHYAGIAVYKLLIFIFFLTPWVVLKFLL